MGNKGYKYIVIAIVVIILFWICIGNSFSDNGSINFFNRDTFRIIASTSTKAMDDEIIKYGNKNGFNVEIDHYGDLEIVDILNDDSSNYDAVWISNSIWLYMLDNSYLTTDSKSIVIDPVVMGITKSKAVELGFVDKDIYNKDILNAIKDKKLNYVMTSVTKTNTGATAYLGFVNSLAGSPEVLTESMLDNQSLITNMTAFFKGVERVSGDELYLKDMFLNGKYEAAITYESTLIDINKDLEKQNKETLYLLYPEDGVAINDMPFAYVNRQQNKEKKFKILQDYLRSKETRSKLEKKGFRTWYGGVKKDASNESFKKEWGINTNKYLIPMKYPSKKVMNKAFNLYVEQLRKPANVVFCLDVSGSMYGDGIDELKKAMNYILDYDQASKDLIQFTDKDKIQIITFNQTVDKESTIVSGNNTSELQSFVNELSAGGGTNIYDAIINANKTLKDTNQAEYTPVIILMTDGRSSGSKSYLSSGVNLSIPVYSITFGDADDRQLEEIAELTNAKVFDGKAGLTEAFTEVRSYS